MYALKRAALLHARSQLVDGVLVAPHPADLVLWEGVRRRAPEARPAVHVGLTEAVLLEGAACSARLGQGAGKENRQKDVGDTPCSTPKQCVRAFQWWDPEALAHWLVRPVQP